MPTAESGIRICPCERCGVPCRVAEKVNPRAGIFVKGDAKTGRFCANCLVVDFFRNFELGPASAMGDWYFDRAKPIPEWEQPDAKRFDPECLRLPEIQAQFAAIVLTATRIHGAELAPGEIDWEKVIADWALPFPEKRRGKGRKKGGA